MASIDLSGKRLRSISPPPRAAIKRVRESLNVRKKADFFVKASQKPPSQTNWSERGYSEDAPNSLLVGRYQPKDYDRKREQGKRSKIAVFDLDGTLIGTRSGGRFAKDSADWKWCHDDVPGVLQALHTEKGYQVIIVSNQGGLSLGKSSDRKKPGGRNKTKVFKDKCEDILDQLDIPTSIYAATENDLFRKPRIGIWSEICDDYDVSDHEVDKEHSFFVGDAAGRLASSVGKGTDAVVTLRPDFSCSDRDFAHNLGLRFTTPEAYFLGNDPRKNNFRRDFDLGNYPFDELNNELCMLDELGFNFTTNPQNMIIFVGQPGSGKSSFFKKYLSGLGYSRVNQDTLKSRAKCEEHARDRETRKVWVQIAKRVKAPVRCIWFQTPYEVCKHNDAVRAFNKSLSADELDRVSLPRQAWTKFNSEFEKPDLEEGFEDILEVSFKFRGTREEYSAWGQYWTDMIRETSK